MPGQHERVLRVARFVLLALAFWGLSKDSCFEQNRVLEDVSSGKLVFICYYLAKFCAKIVLASRTPVIKESRIGFLRDPKRWERWLAELCLPPLTGLCVDFSRHESLVGSSYSTCVMYCVHNSTLICTATAREVYSH